MFLRLCSVGCFWNSHSGTPSCPIKSCFFPGVVINATVFHVSFQHIFAVQLLSTPFSLPIGQLPIKYCLRQTCFWHSSEVAGPPKLWSCDKGFNAIMVFTLSKISTSGTLSSHLTSGNRRRWLLYILVSFLMCLRYRVMHSVEYTA